MVLNRKILFAFVILMLVGWSRSVPADEVPDFAREQRIVDQIEPGIFDGESVWLATADRDFMAIHLPVVAAKGAVILLHGRDANPEEQELVGPLRVGLAEAGWTTLALQLPVLAKGKKYYDYLPILRYAHPRIEAAIRFLREQGETRIILAAHSCGAHMANSWFNTRPAVQLDGYIAMGLGATDAGQALRTPLPLGNLSVPVLDIYGAEEFPRPLAMVEERKQLLQQNGNPRSAQIEVAGANHYFTGYGDTMVALVAEWLGKL